MGSEIQNELEECCRFSEEETEIKKNNSNFLKGTKKINGGVLSNNIEIKKELTFIDNNSYVATLIITDPKIYEKMNKGERLHQILEPLISFLNKNLFEIINQLLIKIIELHKNYTIKNNVYVLFENTYKNLINNQIIDNISKSDLGYYSKIKYNLLHSIEIIVELYHYFNYHIRNENVPYNINYWENIKNTVSFMKEKIQDFQQCIEYINNFILENKPKNLNHSVDIHITASNFNIQLEQ